MALCSLLDVHQTTDKKSSFLSLSFAVVLHDPLFYSGESAQAPPTCSFCFVQLRRIHHVRMVKAVFQTPILYSSLTSLSSLLIFFFIHSLNSCTWPRHPWVNIIISRHHPLFLFFFLQLLLTAPLNVALRISSRAQDCFPVSLFFPALDFSLRWHLFDCHRCRFLLP